MAKGNGETDDAEHELSPQEKGKREIQQIQRQADILRMIAWSAFFSLLLLGFIFLL